MSDSRSVIVVGGGVVGAATAHYLQQRGARVTILEKQTFGAACSHGNCGFVCPSHVLPLSKPDAISSTMKALFRPNSPFSIKPRLDIKLWMWLMNFARHCNERDMIAGGHALQALLLSSMEEYERLVREEIVRCEWQKKGLLYVYRDKQRLDAYEPTNQLLTETFNEPAVKYTSDELAELEPALKPGLAGAWLYEHDAHLRSDRLMESWKERLLSEGATLREGCEVQEIVSRDGRAVSVNTSQGEMTADQIVVATGALTPFLERFLGCKIPIQPGKGYSMTMPRPQICPHVPMIFPECRVAVTPMESGYRLGSIMEFAGYDDSIKPQRLQLLRDGAAAFLKDPYCDPVEEEWYGWRPMTYDSLPIIDRSPTLENVWIAAGHNMIGLSMSTGTGKLIAEMMSGETPHIDPKPFRVTRF
ncbi:MAG: FAD-dependent oxidoreductase [Planctomycetaceae bacterium]|nr:FAD-dependent oxidoreductase [Planctomycetaceae bacterium]